MTPRVLQVQFRSRCYKGFTAPAFILSSFFDFFWFCESPTQQDTGEAGFGDAESRCDSDGSSMFWESNIDPRRNLNPWVEVSDPSVCQSQPVSVAGTSLSGHYVSTKSRPIGLGLCGLWLLLEKLNTLPHKKYLDSGSPSEFLYGVLVYSNFKYIGAVTI